MNALNGQEQTHQVWVNFQQNHQWLLPEWHKVYLGKVAPVVESCRKAMLLCLELDVINPGQPVPERLNAYATNQDPSLSPGLEMICYELELSETGSVLELY